ncbi:MAG: aminotransferase class I/II-fold pyridoxal phosphate-dependent enzyme [Clostridia bacterium]|nr:aminotransferase class I/II-fold pyridoxal phosphate-dependent enzyme [Clostridia bacterium]
MNYSGLISKKVNSIPPSGIRKFFDLANEMEDAISLGVGEPDFITPWHIREACIYSLERGYTHYTSNRGMPELLNEILKYLKDRFGVEYGSEKEIIVTVGASEAIDLAMRAILNDGDEVLIPEPSYVSYMPSVVMAGGKVVPIITKVEDEFKVTPEQLKSCITEKTKAIILPYPNNPTGAIMNRKDLEAIAQVLEGTDIIVVSDEIYAELTYNGEHACFSSIPGMKERTILINGFSKAFAMTGWRLGYAAGPEQIISAMVKIHQYTALCAPIMAQIAAKEALRQGASDGQKDVEEMRKKYNRRRRLMVKSFNEMGLTCFEPRGAFYVFPCIASTGLSSEEFCEQLLREEKVAVVPGTAFGQSGEGFIRCSYAYSIENIREALKRIGKFVTRKK